MPIFQQRPPVYQAAPVHQVRPIRQPFRTARNDIYLPAMPELLQPVKHTQRPQPVRTPAPATATLAQGKGREKETQIVRGQAPEEEERPLAQLLPPTKLDIPEPEMLGVGRRPSTTQAPRIDDWSAARGRLEELGAAYYRLERIDGGNFRFACALPLSQRDSRQQQFEAEAASEQEAIALAMEKVESWSAARQ